LQERRTGAEGVSNVNLVLQGAFDRKIFPELAELEILAPEALGPISVMVVSVNVDRLIQPAVDGEIGLGVAFDSKFS
jgi:hypothetical protein